MRIVRSIIFTFVIFIPVFFAFSQEDPVAEKILDHLSEKTKSLEPFHITFHFTTINLQDKSQSSFTGELILSGKKYHLKTGDSEIFFNGKTIWNYLPDVNEVNIMLPDPEDDSFLAHPERLFTDYKTVFKYHYIGINHIDAKELYVVDLYPTDLKKDYSRIRLQINKTKLLLYSARYFGKTGIQYIVRIDKFVPLKNTDSSAFIFRAADHPGVEVIDLTRDTN